MELGCLAAGGERRAADLEPGATGAADLRSADSGGASGIGLGWQPREDLLLGCFCFFSLSFLFYTARRQAPMTKIGRHESIPVPLSFFL